MPVSVHRVLPEGGDMSRWSESRSKHKRAACLKPYLSQPSVQYSRASHHTAFPGLREASLGSRPLPLRSALDSSCTPLDVQNGVLAVRLPRALERPAHRSRVRRLPPLRLRRERHGPGHAASFLLLFSCVLFSSPILLSSSYFFFFSRVTRALASKR